LWTQSPELLPDEGELKGAQNDVIIRPDGSSGPQKNESTGQALTTQQENRLATCEAAGGNCEQFRNPLSPEKFQNGINETRKQMSDAGADVAREVGIWILLSDFKPFKLAGKWLDSMFGKSAPEIAAKEVEAAAREGALVVRTTRSGEMAVRITRADGSVVDISPQRVKEYVPNTNPNAPPGSLNRVRFPDAQPGSKGLKRDPTSDELETLRNLK
jgi:hypothetical protein